MAAEARELAFFYPLLTAGLEYSGLETQGAGYGIFFVPNESRVFAIVRWKTWLIKCNIITFKNGYYKYYYYELQFSFNVRNGGLNCYESNTPGTNNITSITEQHAEPLPWANRITLMGYSYQTTIMPSELSIISLMAWRKYFLSDIISHMKTHQGMLR